MNRELLDALILSMNKEPKLRCKKTNKDGERMTVKSGTILSNERLIAVRADTNPAYFPEHTHDYVEIVYMCQGETVHIINGEKVVLKEGEFLFMNQNCRQENLPSSSDDIAANFIVHPLFFEHTLRMMDNEETLLHRFIVQCLKEDEEKASYLHFCVSDVLPIQNLVENLIWNLLNDIPNQAKINESTMALLFLQLLNYTDELEYKYDDSRIIFHVLSYIDAHYADGSLTELSESLFYDFNTLSKQIKRQTGRNYTDLVQEKRLSKSCFLLKNTDLGVSEISQKVGYENISYFHRLFNKTYGLSPKKFRDLAK